MELIKVKNAGKNTNRTIQHALYDTGCAFEIHRWEESTGTNRVVETIPYEGHADRAAARAMAMGALDSLHQQALYEIHGDSFIGKYGIKYYWVPSMNCYCSLPED
mgnify:CR=1 FL=1